MEKVGERPLMLAIQDSLDHTLDTLGTVTKEPIHPHKRGKVTFRHTRTWKYLLACYLNRRDLEEGSRIKIVEINGQLIAVEQA